MSLSFINDFNSIIYKKKANQGTIRNKYYEK